jgi:hypothetical protein
VNSIRAVLDENPSWVDVALDAKNAFNSIHRRTFLKVIAERFPSLWSWVWSNYGEPTELYVRRDNLNPEIVLSRSGARLEARELVLDDARWSALFRIKAPLRFASLSTPAEASAKLPHNCSTEELTKFLRDHNEGEHLDRLVGIPPESEGDQTARAKHEDRHRETEYDHRLAAKTARMRVAVAMRKSETDLQIPKEVGDLDKLIIDVLLKPRIATRAACITYESINPPNKGPTIKIVLKEILTAKELTSLTKLVDKMTSLMSCGKSM